MPERGAEIIGLTDEVVRRIAVDEVIGAIPAAGGDGLIDAVLVGSAVLYVVFEVGGVAGAEVGLGEEDESGCIIGQGGDPAAAGGQVEGQLFARFEGEVAGNIGVVVERVVLSRSEAELVVGDVFGDGAEVFDGDGLVVGVER